MQRRRPVRSPGKRQKLKQMKTAGKQNFMHGAAILTAGVIIMKILGAIYKIPLGSILGDYGYGIFIATYTVYNIFFTLSTSGMPVALSRLIAEADASGRKERKEQTFRAALGTFAVIGIVFSSVMFFGSGWLANHYLMKPEAALSVKAMSPAILLVCLVSAYRGYCQGNGNMIPTTVDEVLEVLFKVISGLIISGVLVKTGHGLPQASAGAILGVSIGSVVSLSYMVVYKRRFYSEKDAKSAPDSGIRNCPASGAAADENGKNTDGSGQYVPRHLKEGSRARSIAVSGSTGAIVKNILRIGIPISLGASIMAILTSLDPGICQSRLEAAGYSEYTAGVLYGVYAKVQTLFNLPAAFMTPLTIAIVPAVAGAIAGGSREEANRSSEDAMRISSVISMPMGVGLMVLAYPIVNVLYPGSHEAGPGLLTIMGAASFFVCLVLMENAVLQASGKERLPMYAMVTGSVVKIIINWIIIADPKINIYGAPVGTLFGYVCMAVMDYIFIRRSINMNPSLLRVFGRPLLCSALMGAAAGGTYLLLSKIVGTASKIKLAICMAGGVGIAVVVYAAAVVLFKAVTMKDMKLIPGGEKIGKLLHMKE